MDEYIYNKFEFSYAHNKWNSWINIYMNFLISIIIG